MLHSLKRLVCKLNAAKTTNRTTTGMTWINPHTHRCINQHQKHKTPSTNKKQNKRNEIRKAKMANDALKLIFSIWNHMCDVEWIQFEKLLNYAPRCEFSYVILNTYVCFNVCFIEGFLNFCEYISFALSYLYHSHKFTSIYTKKKEKKSHTRIRECLRMVKIIHTIQYHPIDIFVNILDRIDQSSVPFRYHLCNHILFDLGSYKFAI